MDEVKESVRDVRPGVFMDTLVQDIRSAFRMLQHNRAFAFVAILTLALSIGANTAVFILVDGMMLKPLPYPDPDRLLTLWERSRTDGPQSTVAPANFYDWRGQSPRPSSSASPSEGPGGPAIWNVGAGGGEGEGDGTAVRVEGGAGAA